MLDLEAIKRRIDDVSEGPWGVCRKEGRSGGDIVIGSRLQVNWVCRMFHPLSSVSGTTSLAAVPSQCQANAEFIAHSREDIPALIDEVEHLRAITAVIEPGTMEATVAALFEFAAQECGHSEFSSDPPLSAVKREAERLRAENTKLQVAIDDLTATISSETPT